MYIASPHSSMTFEYNVDCVNTSKTFPSICLCDQWNNDIHFEEITGKQCLFPADDSLWIGDEYAANSTSSNASSANSSGIINQTLAAVAANIHEAKGVHKGTKKSHS